jgi:glycosyltransferase involved in cell wall biosynthesis
METVCAVVATFNRKNLLRQCLEALAAQTRALDRIVVVDNHSTDGTDAMLALEFPHLLCIRLTENRGGAGGFCEGMKYAHLNGYDWLWVMDDDIRAYPETLERMLRYRDLSHFIHVRRATPGGKAIVSIEAIWDLSACIAVQYGTDVSFDSGEREWISLHYGNFEGALINRSVVDKVGYPDERFFVGGDDLIYGYLASFHTNVLLAREVGFCRTIETPPGISRMSYYLGVRNRFLLRDLLRQRGARVDNASFWFHMLRLVWWSVREAMKGLRPGWKTNASVVFRGLFDGARGRFGRPPWIPA